MTCYISAEYSPEFDSEGLQMLILESPLGHPVAHSLAPKLPLEKLTRDITNLATIHGFPVSEIRWKNGE
jgi:hypothetical protein